MRTRILGAWLVGALPLAVSAQTTATTVPASSGNAAGAPAVGGIATIDYVSLQAGNIGAPLRFGHVVVGSELIEVDGRTLVSGADYAVDYETGVVYLKRAQRSGESMVISYRYDPQGKSSGSASFVGVNAFSGLSLAPGLGLVGGFGLAERAADGTVMSSNVYGWNNTLHFGSDGKGSMGGLFLYSERSQNNVQAGLSMDPNAKPGDALKDEGTSHFLLQDFRSALMGGTVTAGVQDISKNFASGGQVKSAGYSDADVTRLMKERGLKREDYGISGMRFGSTAFSASFRDVNDPRGQGVDWRTYGLQQGGLKLNATSQRVDQNFTRFGDLSEADHAQLAKEVGLSRQTLAGEFDQKASKLTFTSSDVQDDKSDQHAVNREAKLDSGKIGLDFGSQDVDKSFSRIGSLTAAEQATWGREVGAQRQWSGMTMALGGKNNPENFAFHQLDVKNDTGGALAMRDVSYTSKTWTLDHVGFGGTGKTMPTGSLQDAEATAFTNRVAGFFATPKTTDAQRAALLGTTDVKRDLTRVSDNFGKGGTLTADQLQFGEGANSGMAESVALATPKMKASYRKQDFNDKFVDASRLEDFERAKLGSVAGVERTDLAFGLQMDKTRSFSFGQLEAKDATGTADRTTLAYTAKGLTVNAAQRNVSKGFANAANLADPEASLLSQFVGFQEHDLTLNYAGGRTYANNVSGLKIQAFVQGADDPTTQEGRSVQNVDAAWQVDKATSVDYVSQSKDDKTPLTTLYDQSLQRLTLIHSFGSLVTLKYIDEQTANAGTTDTSPDQHKQYVGAEAKIDKLTTVKTEQTWVENSDGTKEDTSANTVTRTIAKNVGLSVTDVTVDRTATDNDEHKTNYGFWYDFGKGLRLNYGYAQDLVGETTGTGTQMFTFGATPNTLAPNQANQVGASNVGGILMNGGYGQTTTLATDSTASHVQSFANVGLSTAKPFHYAGFTNLKVNFNLDSATDYSQYIRQSQTAGLSGQYGKNVFTFGYRGQVANPNAAPTAATIGQPQIEAIDRSVALTTDPSPKAPFVVNGSVKVRTLPDDKDYTSRNFTVTARPLAGFELTNQMQTNLEQADPNVLLGSTLLADKADKWSLAYKAGGNATLAAAWEQKGNDATDITSSLSSLNLILFSRSGSPLKLSYGLDHVDGNAVSRQVTRYSVEYDAKATPTQTFTLFLGNVGYVYSLDDELRGTNWTVRMNYQLRF